MKENKELYNQIVSILENHYARRTNYNMAETLGLFKTEQQRKQALIDLDISAQKDAEAIDNLTSEQGDNNA